MLALPLADGQRFPAGAPNGWTNQLLLGFGRDNGVDAGRDDERQEQDNRVEQLGRSQDRLGGAGTLLRAAAVGYCVHAGTCEGGGGDISRGGVTG